MFHYGTQARNDTPQKYSLNKRLNAAPIFDIWQKPEVRAVVKSVYKLRSIYIPGMEMEFYESRLPHIHTVFNQPFAMYSSGNDDEIAKNAALLLNYSRNSGRNILIP